MANMIPSLWNNCTANRCVKYFGVIAILCCIIPVGCKSSDKSKSIIPFFGGGTAVNSPTDEFASGQPPIDPATQLVVRDGPGPATPSSPVLSAQGTSASTSTASNAYAPPDLMANGQSSNQANYNPDNTTMVYNPPPGANTNSGGTAGRIPNTYSANEADTGGTSSSRYGYGGTSTPNGSSNSSNGSSFSTASPVGSYTSSTNTSGYGTGLPANSSSGSTSGTRSGAASSTGGTSNSTNNSGNSDYGGSGYRGTSYGDSDRSNSTSGREYYHGPETGYSSSLAPNTTPLDDGDYLAADGSMKRVINGKSYDLVQYNYRTPPVLPNLNDDFASPSATAPQTATTIQPTNDYRSATQMTQDFSQVPIPTYESLLSQQETGTQISSQGVVTITDPKQTIIVPENATIETVPSLDYSEYSEIGALTASSSAGGYETVAIDDEMRRSIWSIMAGQNNDYLLHGTKTQSESDKNNKPAYFPLSNPLAGYVNQTTGNHQTTGNIAPGFPGSSLSPGQSFRHAPGSYIFYESAPRLFLCPRQTVYQWY